MGSIAERKRRDGTIGFTAQIVIKRGRAVVHSEAQTFDRRPAASRWIKDREAELKSPGGMERAKQAKGNVKLSVAINRYIAESTKAAGRNKTRVLKLILTYPIAEKLCDEIESPDLVEFAGQVRDGRAASTVLTYLSTLSGLFSIAAAAWDYPLSEEAMRKAMKVCRLLGTTEKSGQRTRRPTLDELDRLMAHFVEAERRNPASLPMHRIVAFAVFSMRRQEEITLLRREDHDTEGKRILVRDMKDPGQKVGNNVWCDLPDQAGLILDAMPKSGPLFFPFRSDTVSRRFTEACRFLEIEDLHFHDLRHDGVSRSFEMGASIPRTASVSGHRSWASLKRYTHIRQSGDKYAGWLWLAKVTQAAQ